jgi:putative spermidine/putrescine transport system ATP-binding protein
MSFLDLSQLEKAFGAVRVVKDFSLGIDKGEFVSLLGPSGCGKTTVLRMVAGFEQPSSGSIRVEGRDLVGLKTNQRNIGMVFQAYALFPNLTVAENVAFGLKVAGMGKAEAGSRVAEMLELIGLPDLGARYPFQLSGGQQQRVALARALAPRPRVLLLDEPLSALDAKIRVSLREEIRALQRTLGITTVFVTHDQEEAMAMSDRVVVMRDGRIEQVGTPFEIYNYPASRFVASFVGTLNLLEVKVHDPKAGMLHLDEHRIQCARGLDGAAAGETRTIALRPEAMTMGGVAAPEENNALAAIVEDVKFLGPVIRVSARINNKRIQVDQFNTSNMKPPAEGDPLTLRFAAEDVLVLPAD